MAACLGSRRRWAPRALIPALALGPLLGAAAARAQQAVLTYQYDNARTGANVAETVLTPAAVNGRQFGPLFAHGVDGALYAQPLYVPQVAIAGHGVHNVVYAATEHDSVYAFDADSAEPPNDQPLWHASFVSAAGVTPVPAADLGCGAVTPEVGITGTPVIDAATGILYVVARTKEAGAYVQRLHALDIATGDEKPGSPVVIAATVPGTGDGSVNGSVGFDPLREHQRAGLALVDGVVYVAWASLCDISPYHGWLMGYDASTLAQVTVFNTTPDGGLGGIWQSGAAPAADASGNLYLATGNGTFDADAGGMDYGNSVLKLVGGATVADFFTPFDQAQLSLTDADLGSGSVLLLPDQIGSRPHLLVTCGKAGKVYLIDRDHLGEFHAGADGQIVQSIALAVGGGAFGGPAYWSGTIYYVGNGDVPKAFRLTDGMLSSAPVSMAATTFIFPGATPVVSAAGDAGGILWAVQVGGSQQAVLHAYDATDLSRELYNSDAAGVRNLGPAVKFTPPLVVNGKVYVPGAAQLTAFGLAGQTPAVTPQPAATPSPRPVGGGGCSFIPDSRAAPLLLILLIGALFRRRAG